MAAAEYTHSPSPEEIMEFLDGEGTAAGRTAIEAHLADCAACRVIASEQRQLSDETSAWTVGPAPAAAPAQALAAAGSWRPGASLDSIGTHRGWSRGRGCCCDFLAARCRESAPEAQSAPGIPECSLDYSQSNSDTASVAAPADGDSTVSEPSPVIDDSKLVANLERSQLSSPATIEQRPIGSPISLPRPRPESRQSSELPNSGSSPRTSRPCSPLSNRR